MARRRGRACRCCSRACSSSPDNKQVSLELPQLTLPNPAAQAATPTAEQRENARILASYGGVYNDPKLHVDGQPAGRPPGRGLGKAGPEI